MARRVSILVSEGTHDWIMEEIARLIDAAEIGGQDVEGYNPDTKNPNAPKLSVERFLISLLERRQRHRERRRAAAAARRGRAKRRPSRANVEQHQGAERG